MFNVSVGFRALPLLAALPLMLLACEVDTGATPTGPVIGPNDPIVSDGGTPVDNEPSCPTTFTGPTIHKGDIQGDETWTAESGPHIVEQTVNVRNGAKLTIAPCAEVRVKAKQYIHVAYPITPNTGTLISEGTAKRPIKFVGDQGERWSSISIRAGGTARFAHVTFENGGGGDFQQHATLAAYGRSEGSEPMVFADHVTIKGSLGTGLFLTRGASFMQGSRDLTVTGSGDDVDPYPVEMEEHAFDTLPTGSYTGNRKDEILVRPMGGGVAGSGLLADATVHDRGVPYHIGDSTGSSLRIGGRTDKKVVTMTIEPGVVMKFMPGGALKVQHFWNLEPSTASLRALGTADKPIVFTSVKDVPGAGDWNGVYYGGVPDASNALEHVKIEYAGGDCGCSLLTCSSITQHDAAVIFSAQPKSAFIKNTTISKSAGHGILEGFDGTFVDFKPSNTFEALSGCSQTLPRNPVACPAPRPACD